MTQARTRRFLRLATNDSSLFEYDHRHRFIVSVSDYHSLAGSRARAGSRTRTTGTATGMALQIRSEPAKVEACHSGYQSRCGRISESASGSLHCGSLALAGPGPSRRRARRDS